MIHGLSELYLEALCAHLAHDSPGIFEPAHDMGRQFLANGMETLGVAQIHEVALAALIPSGCPPATRDDMSRRAAAFFAEAVTPIEETHRAAIDAGLELQRMSEALDRRTKDLADSNSELQQQITGRQTVEAAFKTSEAAAGVLLKESRLLEEHLQDMARKILSANEVERKQMSHRLQEEIAQTLLGIHVRLLALKKATAASNASLNDEITTIEKLVAESVKITNRLAREFCTQHE